MDYDKVKTNILRIREEVSDELRRASQEKQVPDATLLVDYMFKLQVYNNYLSDHLPDFHKEKTDATFKAFRENEKLGATKAKMFAEGLTTDIRHRYEQAKTLYDATENLLSRLQSYIRVVESQYKGQTQRT